MLLPHSFGGYFFTMTGYEIDNKLFDLLSTEQISFGAYAVGHYIKKIQNQKGIRVFTFVISSMATTMGISRQVGSKYFHELVNCGFIKVIEMTAKNGVKIYLDVNNDVNDGVKIINIKTSDVNDGVNDGVNDDVNDDVKKINTLKKEERRKKNKELLTNNNKGKIEPFKTPEKTIEELWDLFMDQVNARMHIFRLNFQLSDEKVLERCENFKNFGLLKGNTYTNQFKMFDHFVHWNNKQVDRPKKKLDSSNMTADQIAEFVASKIIK